MLMKLPVVWSSAQNSSATNGGRHTAEGCPQTETLYSKAMKVEFRMSQGCFAQIREVLFKEHSYCKGCSYHRSLAKSAPQLIES